MRNSYFDDVYGDIKDEDLKDFVVVQEYKGYRTMTIEASSLQDAIEQIENRDESNVHTYHEDTDDNVYGQVISVKLAENDYEL
jgi:hypothetical protein